MAWPYAFTTDPHSTFSYYTTQHPHLPPIMANPYANPNIGDPYRLNNSSMPSAAGLPSSSPYDTYAYPQQQQQGPTRYPVPGYPAPQPRQAAIPNLDAFGRPLIPPPTLPPPPPPPPLAQSMPGMYPSAMTTYQQQQQLPRQGMMAGYAPTLQPQVPYYGAYATGLASYGQPAVLPAQHYAASPPQQVYGGYPQANSYAPSVPYEMQAYNAAMAKSYQEGFESRDRGRHRGSEAGRSHHHHHRRSRSHSRASSRSSDDGHKSSNKRKSSDHTRLKDTLVGTGVGLLIKEGLDKFKERHDHDGSGSGQTGSGRSNH